VPSTTPVDFGNDFAFDRAQSNNYRKYQTDSTFTYDPGVMVLPVASDTPMTVTVRYHGGYGTRTVAFDAMKNGNPPILPAANDTDDDKLIGATINVGIPIPDTINNGYIWSAQGTYRFVTLDDPRIPGRDYFPAVQRPYAVPQDDVALGMLGGGTIDDVKDSITPSDFQRGTYSWPFTIYPDIFFNAKLIY
jgi:hypothetical protein